MSAPGPDGSGDRIAPAVVVAAVIVALLVVAGIVVALSREGRPATPAVVSPSPVITAPAPGQAAPPTGHVSPVSAGDLASAKTVAARFVASYLPYLYGRASATAVVEVTGALRAQLAAGTPQITPAEQRRSPRLEALQVVGQTADQILATATVADGGVASYAVRFVLQRPHGRWIVAATAQ